MLIGVPKEIKDHEYRVGLTPAGAKALVLAGHEVRVQAGAGMAIGLSDPLYAAAGARVVAAAAKVYACELVIKVKEPQPAEIPLIRPGLVLFCYLHLAAAPELARELIERQAIGIAYETVSGSHGELPLLMPMSQVAGRLAIQAGALALTMAHGGSGTLLSGVPGVPPARVLILGGGVVGSNAARLALGLGADVTLLDRSPARMRRLEEIFGAGLKTRHSDAEAVAECARQADLVVGAVLLPGKRAPKLLTRATVAAMKPGSALVDVSIDQGGCAETSRPTTHSAPMYVEEGVVHYCVTNMPAATARTSTLALTQATLPYALALAAKGYRRALRDDPGLRAGLNLCLGRVTHASLAEDLGYALTPAEELLT